jgi:preprotein translocase subunit SecF
MKKIYQFSKFFLPAAIISCTLVAFSLTGYFAKGFTLGVDFQAGLIQEVQIAPTAFSITWNGTSNATLSYDRSAMYIVVSGSGIENRTYTFPFSEYSNIGSLSRAMTQQLEDIEVDVVANFGISSQWLLFSSQGNPYLSSDNPFVIHYLDPQSSPIDISEVRVAMAGFSQGISVQSVGARQDRQFMIRIEDKDEGRVQSTQVLQILEAYFGKGNVAVVRSDYVGSRFSKDLTDQAGMLIFLTLLVMLLYVTIRFKAQYGIGLVLGIMHDGLVVVAFVIWSGMEFSTTTIAAILTILGYSTNNTIVVYDRIRENRRIYPDHSFVDVMNISLTNVLARTIILSLTTMLAVFFLFLFAKGSMRDFALALMVGLVSGVYTTLFIASGFVNFFEDMKIKKEKKKLAVAV